MASRRFVTRIRLSTRRVSVHHFDMLALGLALDVQAKFPQMTIENDQEMWVGDVGDWANEWFANRLGRTPEEVERSLEAYPSFEPSCKRRVEGFKQAADKVARVGENDSLSSKVRRVVTARAERSEWALGSASGAGAAGDDPGAHTADNYAAAATSSGSRTRKRSRRGRPVPDESQGSTTPAASSTDPPVDRSKAKFPIMKPQPKR